MQGGLGTKNRFFIVLEDTLVLTIVIHKIIIQYKDGKELYLVRSKSTISLRWHIFLLKILFKVLHIVRRTSGMGAECSVS